MQPATLHQPGLEPRYDMYMGIHKALRAYMSDTLAIIGRMDIDDENDVAQALDQLRELLTICHQHLRHENHFVHAAMERRAAGSAAHIADEHIEHEREIDQLRALAAAFEAVESAQKRVQALHLYRELSLFIAKNFEHMQYEESTHNAVLWSVYSDAELLEIEAELKASIAPQEMIVIARWMLCANDHAFRVAMLNGVRAHAPQPVFDALLAVAREHLAKHDWEKLARAIAVPLAA